AGLDCPDKLPTGINLIDTQNYPIYSKEDGVKEPLCKFEKPWPGTKVKWTPGQAVTVKFNPYAVSHGGGHCQFSISYDNGKSFAVIYEVLQYCFVGTKPKDIYFDNVVHPEYTFKLPSDLPASDTAVFAWTWVTAVGNREFFMNCADIIIENSSSESYTGKQTTIANYPSYPTIPEFEMDYTTGLEYYINAKNITISPSSASKNTMSSTNTNSTIVARALSSVSVKALKQEVSLNVSSVSVSKDNEKCDEEPLDENPNNLFSVVPKAISEPPNSNDSTSSDEEDDKCDDDNTNGSEVKLDEELVSSLVQQDVEPSSSTSSDEEDDKCDDDNTNENGANPGKELVSSLVQQDVEPSSSTSSDEEDDKCDDDNTNENGANPGKELVSSLVQQDVEPSSSTSDDDEDDKCDDDNTNENGASPGKELVSSLVQQDGEPSSSTSGDDEDDKCDDDNTITNNSDSRILDQIAISSSNSLSSASSNIKDNIIPEGAGAVINNNEPKSLSPGLDLATIKSEDIVEFIHSLAANFDLDVSVLNNKNGTELENAALTTLSSAIKGHTSETPTATDISSETELGDLDSCESDTEDIETCEPDTENT
ncbi:hypothetical protein GGF37_004561, partial [Kickxella alabastrina]